VKSKGLTLHQAAGIVIVDACFCILFAWWGRNALQAGDKFGENLYCVGAAILFSSLPLYVRNFFRVKRGAPVMVKRKPSPPTPQAGFRLLCIIMGVGTLAVIAITNLLARDFHTLKTLEERLFTIGYGMTLWLLHGFGWFWLLSQRPSPPLAAQKQPEGVWPRLRVLPPKKITKIDILCYRG
jgi:hypothetical protein